MIIPVRCFTCGKVIGSKWKKWLELLAEAEKKEMNADGNSNEQEIKEIEFKNFEPGHKRAILDAIGLKRMCCSKNVLTHVDLIDVI